MKAKHIAVIALIAIATACSDDTLNIGNTLIAENDKLEVTAATYNAQSRTIIADSVLSRSNICYFGRIIDPETDAAVTSEFMTQFHILETIQLYSDDKIISREDGMAVADSCRIELYFNNPSTACDTLAPMKLRVYELSKPMDEAEVYYSNYDPIERGYIRTGGLTTDKMFSYSDQTIVGERKSSASDYSYSNYIYIPLNMPYTDREGVTYKNYGTYIIQQYQRHPEYFKNAYQFIHNVCPGFYFQILDGYGFYTQVPDMALRFYYTVNNNDSVFATNIALAGTEEVLQTTKIANDNEAIRQLAADNSCTYIKSPAGLFTEVTMPVDEIKAGHENDSLLAAKVSFMRINNKEQSKYSLGVPTNLLLLPKDSLYSFFEHKSLNDNKTTFYTTFSSSANAYTFNNISSLITAMYNRRRQGMQADSRWEENHPNWNKVVLVPVTLTTVAINSSTLTTDLAHDMSITSTKLAGGSNNANSPIEISVVYGQFKK